MQATDDQRTQAVDHQQTQTTTRQQMEGPSHRGTQMLGPQQTQTTNHLQTQTRDSQLVGTTGHQVMQSSDHPQTQSTDRSPVQTIGHLDMQTLDHQQKQTTKRQQVENTSQQGMQTPDHRQTQTTERPQMEKTSHEEMQTPGQLRAHTVGHHQTQTMDHVQTQAVDYQTITNHQGPQSTNLSSATLNMMRHQVTSTSGANDAENNSMGAQESLTFKAINEGARITQAQFDRISKRYGHACLRDGTVYLRSCAMSTSHGVCGANASATRVNNGVAETEYPFFRGDRGFKMHILNKHGCSIPIAQSVDKYCTLKPVPYDDALRISDGSSPGDPVVVSDGIKIRMYGPNGKGTYRYAAIQTRPDTLRLENTPVGGFTSSSSTWETLTPGSTDNLLGYFSDSDGSSRPNKRSRQLP